MKLDIKEFAGKVKPIKDNELYALHDLEYLDRLNVCMNILHPGKATLGHEHENVDEVYIVMDGEGEMDLEGNRFKISTGDIILIKGGQFHRTFNTTDSDLVFLTVFEKYEGRGGTKQVKYDQEEPAQQGTTQNPAQASSPEASQ